jgi:hypothetical protein
MILRIFIFLQEFISQEKRGEKLTFYNPKKSIIKENLGIGCHRLNRLAKLLFKDKSFGKLPICYTNFLKYYCLTCNDIGIRSKRNDVCNCCSKFRNILSTGTNKEKKDEILEEWKKHLEESNYRRKVYKEFKNNPPKNCLVISYDYKMNIALPHLLWQPNIIYYKRKKKICCFDIVNEHEDLSNIYLYDEIYVGKTCNEIITMLENFLQKYKKKNLDLVVFSDNV